MQGKQVRPEQPFQPNSRKKKLSNPSLHVLSRWPRSIPIDWQSRTRFIRLPYRELNQTANRVARAILAKKGERSEAVGLLFGNGALRIAGMFGVLKAGKFLVLLDASSPTARLKYILENSQTRLIVADTVHLGSAEKLISHEIDLITIDEVGESHPKDNIGLQVPPDAVARISYTSGSTGNPKGCYKSHRSLLHQAMNTTNDYRIGPDDRVSCLHQGWTQDLFGALLNGASVHPLHFHEKGLEALPRWLAKEEITILHMVPTLYRHLVDSMDGKNLVSSLRLIILTGETVYRSDVEQFKKRFSPPCLLVKPAGEQ